MAALSPNELFKKRTECRRNIFITKFEREEPFDMEAGCKKLILDKSDPNNIKLIKIIRSSEYASELNGKSFSGWDFDLHKGKRTKENKRDHFLSNFSKTSEFGGMGGRSGTGLSASDATRLGESAAAVFAQAVFINPRSKFSKDDINHAYRTADVDGGLEDIHVKMTENWFLSTRLTADKIKEYFGYVPGVRFHRGGPFVKSIETHFKKLNKKEQKFSNVNKWSPADIWLTTPKGRGELLEEFRKTTSIFQMNQVLRRALNSKDIVGISLKMVANSPSVKVINNNILEKRKKLQYDGHIIGSASFFSSMDAYLLFTLPSGSKGKMQLRTFAETFQGEIKGETANHGKISYGPMISFMKELRIGNQNGTLYGSSKFDVNGLKTRLKDSNDKIYEDFYNLYKYVNKDSKEVNIDEFKKLLEDKSNDWKFSKYMASALVKTLKESNKGDLFISQSISYAASESQLSAPFVKIS